MVFTVLSAFICFLPYTAARLRGEVGKGTKVFKRVGFTQNVLQSGDVCTVHWPLPTVGTYGYLEYMLDST